MIVIFLTEYVFSVVSACERRNLHCYRKWKLINAGKFVYDVSVRRHALPPVRTGREVLSTLRRCWEGGSKTYSRRLSGFSYF